MITNKRAREIAADWYEGDASGLYKIVCNDRTRWPSFTEHDWRDAYNEAHDEEKAAIAEGRKRDATALHALRRWIFAHALQYGMASGLEEV